MSVNKRSGVGHATTIDAVKTIQTTISRAIQKRTYDEFQEKSPENFRTKPPAAGAFKEDFTRPTLQNICFQPLEAGQIQTLNNPRWLSEYSQRKALGLTPSGTADPTLDLSFPGYGLPKQLVSNFSKLGIRSIYPWQSHCLLQSGALQGDKNLVYTAPTGGGKSLVADIVMLKRVIEDPESKALLVLPYVALVQEKLRWLRSAVEGITKSVGAEAANKNFPARFRPRGDENNVRLAGLFGGSKLKASWADMDIAVCTIEKVSEYDLELQNQN
jgi:DNA polymerase theta